MGHPKLEYMLISNTVRLAQSKGLHLQPSSTTKLSASEILLRSRLFWTIYFYEKHIAYRAGRPSVGCRRRPVEILFYSSQIPLDDQ